MPADADQSDPPEGDHRAAATAFADRVRSAFGGEVVGIHLFGSVATGSHRPTSDVDILVVVADDAPFGAVDDRLLDIAYDVMLAHGIPVEVHTVREAAFEAREERGEPFVGRVVREGVRV